MAATVVGRLTFYSLHDMACERDILKSVCQFDCTFSYGLNTTETSDTIDFGQSQKPRWPPQEFEDLQCALYKILLVNAIS